MLTWEALWRIARNAFSFSHIFFYFQKYLLWLIVFVPMICLNDVFLWKAITGVCLNTFPNVLLIFNIFHCLLIIYLIFGKVGLNVNKNGIKLISTFHWSDFIDQIVYFFDLVSNVFFVPFIHFILYTIYIYINIYIYIYIYIHICIYIHILSESNLGLLRGLGWSSFLIIAVSSRLLLSRRALS